MLTVHRMNHEQEDVVVRVIVSEIWVKIKRKVNTRPAVRVSCLRRDNLLYSNAPWVSVFCLAQ